MSDTSIFEIDNMDVDLKQYVKVRAKSALNDSVIFKFLVYNDSSPVDLSNFNVEFRARLPQSGTIYSEVDNITKSGNLLTINCESVLCSEIGEATITLRLWDNVTYKQKSNYIIILKVMATIDEDENIATTSTLSALNSLDYAIDRYLELKIDLLDAIDDANIALTNINSGISNANTTISNVNTSINNANTTKSALDTSNTTALATKTALDTSTTIANTAKSNLDMSTGTANVAKTNLDISNTTAQTTLIDLTDEVALADQKITDLQSFDPNSVVQNTNIMLSQMYCDNQLLSINHNLNGYPDAQLIYTEYGAGVGGAGDFPAGANSECNKIASKIIYTDNNNLTVYVPDDYFITNIFINKINDYKYIVTSSSSTKSILIQLKL